MSPTRLLTVAALSLAFTACTASRQNQTVKPQQKLEFDAVLVTGDLELEKLNDEELFVAAQSFFAAQDYRQAARFFGRIADFHPQSRHRRGALYNAGLALEKLKEWDEAYARFSELADPEKGTGDALDASFRMAEVLYHLDRHEDAAALLTKIVDRTDLPSSKRVEAQVQNGICQLEGGSRDDAERSLRRAIAMANELPEHDDIDDYFPAQAQFFLGEIYRLHYEAVQLDPEKGADKLGTDLEYKAELLLSAQGHYLRAIRIGNGYWATAAGAQIGGLYENLYDHMAQSPAPKELNAEEALVYRQELRRKVRVLITKAINIYERTLEAAERIGASSQFVDRTRESLKRMKDQLIADAEKEDGTTSADDDAPLPEAPVDSADKKGKRGSPKAAASSAEPHS